MARRIRIRIVWKRSDFALLAMTLIRMAEAELQAEANGEAVVNEDGDG